MSIEKEFGDSFMPAVPRVSFMRRLQWRPTSRGGWTTSILDTTYPEVLTIAPDQFSDEPQWLLLVSRPTNPTINARRLGVFPDVDAAKEFARKMVGDPE